MRVCPRYLALRLHPAGIRLHSGIIRYKSGGDKQHYI